MKKRFSLIPVITYCGASLVSTSCLAENPPFNLEITYDSTLITNQGRTQQINRSLTTVGYQQNSATTRAAQSRRAQISAPENSRPPSGSRSAPQR